MRIRTFPICRHALVNVIRKSFTQQQLARTSITFESMLNTRLQTKPESIVRFVPSRIWWLPKQCRQRSVVVCGKWVSTYSSTQYEATDFLSHRNVFVLRTPLQHLLYVHDLYDDAQAFRSNEFRAVRNAATVNF